MREREREKETECEWGRGRERERETQNLKQAPGSEPAAQSPMRGWNLELRDHDLSRSQILNY